MSTTLPKLSLFKDPTPSRSQMKIVSLGYLGDTPLTVHPPIGCSYTITRGNTTAIVPNIKAYKFSTKDSVVATIHNHDDNNKVEIEGGTWVEGTEPLTVTVTLKRAAP